VLAIDKPAGWLLAPDYWDKTGRNLQLALQSSVKAGDFWARARNLKFLRFVHRLDAETTGALLFVKSAGALPAYSGLFESRAMEKVYLAVVQGVPAQSQWVCSQEIGPDPEVAARMKVESRDAKPAETQFRVLESSRNKSLVEARPLTGRTHQIRVHLQAAGHPVVGDGLYGGKPGISKRPARLGLRAIFLGYRDPFTNRPVRIEAPFTDFASAFGFSGASPSPPKRTTWAKTPS